MSESFQGILWSPCILSPCPRIWTARAIWGILVDAMPAAGRTKSSVGNLGVGTLGARGLRPRGRTTLKSSIPSTAGKSSGLLWAPESVGRGSSIQGQSPDSYCTFPFPGRAGLGPALAQPSVWRAWGPRNRDADASWCLVVARGGAARAVGLGGGRAYQLKEQRVGLELGEEAGEQGFERPWLRISARS